MLSILNNSTSVLGLEMENSKEKFITVGSPEDQRQMIMRGKRTKLSRPAVVSSSSSSGCSVGGRGENDHVYFSIPSPTSSGENSACTEEDEDMANCLILLAQSGGDNSVKQETEEMKAEKFTSSPKLKETVTTGEARFHVYECKTCNRSFTSFQALGGHRASHKKPKAVIEEKKVVVPSNNDGQINEGERENVQFNKTSTSLSLYKSSQHNNNNNIKPKVHECSICGSEFSSGQALGGHMRRHRSIPTTNNNNNIIDENEKPRNILQLDLNLPPPEDDHRDSKFPFIFSAPALVGCHY